jgi:hypothetical protein
MQWLSVLGENIDVLIGGVLTIMILLTFIRILFCRNDRDLFKKILGGLTVFLIAIISKNPYIYFTALFIGGLLIASEQFLLLLASLMRAKSSDISKIAEKFPQLSPTEIKEKREDDIKIQLNKPIKLESKEKVEKLGIAIEIVERSILRMLKLKVLFNSGILFREYIRTNIDQKVIVFDGIIVEKNSEKIIDAFEIKLLKNMETKGVERVMETYKSLLKIIPYELHVIFVFQEYDHEAAQKLLTVRKKYKNMFSNLRVSYYKLEDKSYSKFEDINTEDIEDLYNRFNQLPF